MFRKTGFVGRLLIMSPNYTAATATACMVYVVRQRSVIAGEFERWKLLKALRSVTHAFLFPDVYVLLSCSSLFR